MQGRALPGAVFNLRADYRPGAMALRRAQPSDETFLLELYADHRRNELDQASWKAGAREAFLQQQCSAQLHHYRFHYPDAEHDIILVGDEAAGRLYVNRGEDEIRLLDISLLERFRNRGIGTLLMNRLLDEADAMIVPIRLYVYRMNRAVEFYERLGFRCIEDTGVHYFMERIAGSHRLSRQTEEFEPPFNSGVANE